MSVLRERLAAKIPTVVERVRRLVQEHGYHVVSEVTVAQILGGARGVRMMTWEPSLLDPEEGIRFRGLSIPEVIEKLPRAEGSQQPLPEAQFFLLLTGDVPTAEEATSVRRAWARRNKVPLHVWDTLDALPKSTHPMTQFTVGIMALGTESEFARAYAEGLSKADYWKPTYEDAMTLLARLPQVAAYIYRRTYRDGQRIPPDVNRDWAANFAHMLGVETPEFAELMRLYLVLHSDHEGGNVSAHTTRLVGSALSDAYLAFAAAMNGLAGPLHGLANQEVLRWILEMQQRLGDAVHDKAAIERYVWETLESGRVIPGYGHAVLRKTDPRYTAQREFALAHMPDDPIFRIVSDLYEIVPRVLKEQGKAKNPWPNVDAHSGALLWHYGIREYQYYTVLFGLSRALGVLANLVWDRALGLPLERPKSITTRALAEELAAIPRT